MSIIFALRPTYAPGCSMLAAYVPKHEGPTTTHQYVEAGPAMKEHALGRLQEPDAAIRRDKAPDSLMAFLKTL